MGILRNKHSSAKIKKLNGLFLSVRRWLNLPRYQISDSREALFEENIFKGGSGNFLLWGAKIK